MIRKTFIVGALAIAGTLAAGVARASDVQWSLSIGLPIGVPVYSQPYPVYQQPYPVYVQPAPAVVYRSSGGYDHRRAPQYVAPTRWDRDGDGVPNRYDQVYNPRWDRDGDGIPNRYERYGHNERYAQPYRNDRDRDGIPDWQERNGYRR